jgi:hypothetical protein
MNMGDKDIPIVLIEWGGMIRKGADRQWRQPVIYTLDDGRKVDASETFRLKRDAVAFAATLPAPPTHPKRAMFDGDRFYGTSTSYYIGPRS